MQKILDKLSQIGIVPVIKIDDAEKTVPLANSLIAGGIPCAEVTFRTAEGEEAIRRIAAEVPQCLVGAGTVLTTEQVDRAINAGAQFVVTPGFNPDVVSYCLGKGMPIVPGCSSPSDMERALALGLTAVKFFPAEQSGGLPFLKAVAAPYSKLRFMPTGGINTDNLNTYLAFDKIIACGGSWMVKPELVKAGKFDEITALCREAMAKMLDFSLMHIGINADAPQDASLMAQSFADLFGFTAKEGNSSVFAGSYIEVMKSKGRGAHGHIAIGTSSVERAMYYLEGKGESFLPETANRGDNGIIKSIYMQKEIGGFAIHLLRK